MWARRKPVSKAKGRERTLTAVRSSLLHAEEPSIPVLFAAGRARPQDGGGDGDGDGGAPRFVLLGEQLLIRRGGPDDDQAVGELALADALVSGRHALLRVVGEGVELEDLGSKNGTFLPGERITGRRPLGPGVPFFVGEHAFLWRLVSPVAFAALEEEAARPLAPVATVSPALALVTQKLRRWAGGSEEILLVGETGVGKEVYARAVHAASARGGQLVAVNCAALPAELVESELFGYRAGAHSTARAGKPGLVEMADGGTLFLDEVGEMPREGQAKLLRFLQDRELVPLGGTRPRRLDVRVLAATNRPVDPALPGSLRSDLLGRLGAAPVVIPPLRERLEDLGTLAGHFLGQTPAASHGFEGPAFRALFGYRWPLNVRELQKMILAAGRLTDGRRPIALRDLPVTLLGMPAGGTPPPASETTPAPQPHPDPRAAVAPDGGGARKAPSPGPSREQLEALLVRHRGNVADVSRELGRQRAAVWRWIKRFGLGVEKHREK
jgi:sigma-54 dependent transcriptional regulator, acetoin dehydrogenase operon transcriptional activator AcoR